MTKLDVVKRVEHIREIAGDDEAAHHTQDALYGDVLRSIAADPSNAKELAEEALKSEDIEFSRWYA